MTPPPDSALAHDTGVNALIYHQRAIARLTVGLYPLYQAGTIPYEPLPETMLAEGHSTPTPDLICYDHQAEQTRVIIEVCQTNGQKRDIGKIIHLIDGEEYGIQEGFVYNYKTR